MASTDSRASERARFGATAGAYTLLVIAIVAAANFLAYRFNRSYDLTSNKRFTLSQETEKLIRNLPQDATIVYFDLPAAFDQAKGLLDRYRNLSTKVHVEYSNPKTDPIRAREFGVRYAGSAYVVEGNRREEAKSFDEQGITAAFLKISKGVRKVCFVSGAKEHAPEDKDRNGLSIFKSLLERDNYQPETISLLDKSQVPGDCKVLVIAGPKADYTANEVTAVKSYVEGGGRTFFMLDPPLDLRSEHISENAGLVGLLDSWGVTLDKDLVLEESPLVQLYGLETPMVNHYDAHPIVSDLGSSFTIFPIMRSLEVKNAGKSTVTKLFSTSANALGAVNLSGTKKIDPADPSNKKGPFALAAAGNYDTGKAGEGGRFVVIGGSSFASNEMITVASNRDLALNAVNWLSSDEDLISIRQKEPEDRRLDPRGMNLFQFADYGAIPLLIIAAGIAVYAKRR